MHLALLILLSTPPPDFEAEVPVVTVCDVLANREQYLNSDVIVVSRFELRGGSIDAYDFLGEDGCEQPVVTKEKKWPNEILVANEDGGLPPKAPSEQPALDRLLIAKRLAEVRQKTKLHAHKTPVIKSEWAAVYGRIFFSNDLESKPCDNKNVGCRGFLGAPIAIVVNSRSVHFLNNNGTIRKDADPRRQ